jgi:hypothetical protein
MKKSLFILVIIFLVGMISLSCSPAAPTSAPAAATMIPTIEVSSTPVPPTATVEPSPTATEAVIQPPASRYLPEQPDLGQDYKTSDNLVSDNLGAQIQLPLPRENLAATSFDFNGKHDLTGPQEGMYITLTYWIIVAPDEPSAKLFFQMAKTPDYQKQAFLVIMPAAVHQTIQTINTVPAKPGTCDEINILTVTSDPYADLRNSKKFPTAIPEMCHEMGCFQPEQLAKLPPDLYLFTSCRIKNAMVMFWGYTPNNFDGKYTPLPDDVIAGQVNQFLKIVVDKLK